jgi:alkaline phosphatase D
VYLSVLAAGCAVESAPPYSPIEHDAARPKPVMWRECGCDAGMPEGELIALTHGPLLGAVTDRSIKIWVRGDRAGSFHVRMWSSDDPDAARCSAPVDVDRNQDLTGVALLVDLEPSTVYGYRLEHASDDGCSIAISEDAEFRTLPKEGEPAQIRFAVGADVHGSVLVNNVVVARMSVPGFADVEAVAPDFMLMIGDNVYADADGLGAGGFDAHFALGQKLYHDVWGSPQFRSLFAQVPVFMIWDDHELMENYWRGKDDLVYDVGRTLYDSYQGNHNPDPIEPAELYYSFRAGDVGFFVFDTRTHRDGNMDSDDEDKSMLGAAQRQAFEEWLAEDSSKVHVIVSSVLVGNFTTTGADPWTSFRVERDALLQVIADHRTPNTFVISGDQHWSAILHMELGDDAPYSLYEFQSTPLGSGIRGAPQRADESVLALDNTHQVFGVFDVDTQVDPPRLEYTLCAVGESCTPHMERPPTELDVTVATVPYSVSFKGSDRGFVMVPSE